MNILIILLSLFLTTRVAYSDAVIFSGNDVKALKYNLDLFGRSKVMGLNVDPSSGAGVAAPLGSLGMDYLTGDVYYKNGAGNTQWVSLTGAIEGTPFQYAAYDTNGILNDLPGVNYISNATQYTAMQIPYAPASTVTSARAVVSDMDIDGQTMTDNTSYDVLNNYGSTTATTVTTTTGYGFAATYEANFTTVNSRAFGDFLTIDNGATVNFHIGMLSTPTVNEDIQGYQGVYVAPSVGAGSATVINNLTSLQASPTVDVNGETVYHADLGIYTQYQAGANFTDYVGINMNPELNSTNLANSVTLINANSQIGNDNTTNFPFYTGISATGNFLNNSSIDNFNGLNVNYDFSTGTDFDNGTLLNLSSDIDVVAVNSFSSINSNPNFGQASATNITFYNDVNINPNFGANATIDNYNGITITPNVTAGATITNNYYGVNISSNAALPVGGVVTGVNVDLQNFTSPAQKVGVNIVDGALSVQSQIKSNDAFFGLASNANYMGGQFEIVNGSPVSGPFVFGNNLAVNLLADDDMDPDVTTLGLGYSVVGFVSQAAVTTGHTVDRFNLATAGFGIPVASTGGTIIDAVLYNAIGALPQGGTLNVTNMYGFRAGPGLSGAAPTNLWGISIEDPNAENYFEKSLAIDTATRKVTGPLVGLEIGNGKEMRVDGNILTKDSFSFEDPGAGVNKITFIADTLTADRTYFWPDSVGSNNYVLTTDGTGILTWEIPDDTNAIKQNGNAFGVNVSIGTNDAFNVNIRTNGSNIATFDQNGFLAINGSSAPTASAALDIQGTDGALLYPRLTTVQRNALTAVAGMMIYNTTNSAFECYATSAWVPCGSAMIVSSDLTLTASDTIAINLFVGFQQWRVQGNTSAVTLSTTPFGTSAPQDGAQITLVGVDDTNTVTLIYSDIADGYVGPDVTLGRFDTLTVQYNAALDRYVYVSGSF